MDTGFIFHVNKFGTILHVQTFGEGSRVLPRPYIRLLGVNMQDIFDKTNHFAIQRCVNLAFSTGVSDSPFAFSYEDVYKKKCVGRVTYLENEKVLIVFDFSNNCI